MKVVGEQLRLSATDLANFLGCRHLTRLDYDVAYKRRGPPDFHDPALASLAKRGQLHEDAYLAKLEADGLRVAKLDRDDDVRNREQVTRLMHEGVDVIAQAVMSSGRWFGYADFLVRVATTNDGKHLYEVQDTKLARETRAGAVLQLALYSDILEEMQGVRPELMKVISPSADGCAFDIDALRFDDYRAYYKAVRKRLEQTVDGAPAETKAEPVEKCSSCRWVNECEAALRKRDHLSFVARSTRGQRDELERHSIPSLTALADSPLLQFRPERGTIESLERLREQARLQKASVNRVPEVKLLPAAANTGLSRLPEPDHGDIFFDFEGDPFVVGGGLEYLFGYAYRDEKGDERYWRAWAFNHADEKRVFESFVDDLMARWRAHPKMHVYHFAPYEPTAMRRLMLRHNTRVDELDDMLRRGLFVDLYAVVREGLMVGVESYSIKQLEPCFGFDRDLPLRDVGPHKRAVEAALEFTANAKAEVAQESLDVVETYNRHDCQSAMRLRDWLEQLRSRVEGVSRPVPVEPNNAAERNEARIQREARERIQAIAAACTDPHQKRALDVLAAMVEFHARESKVVWWELFRLRDLKPDDLRDETHALVGLALQPREPGDDEKLERYVFPPQPIDARDGDNVYRVGVADDEWEIGEVVSIDRINNVLCIERKKAGALTNAYFHSHVRPQPLPDALLGFANAIAERGFDGASDYRAACDLLLRLPPRLKPTSKGLAMHDESPLERTIRVAHDLDNGVLAIQGPPGAGKTFTAANIIVSLVKAGKTVGVTGPSHKVVVNLMKKVLELDPSVRCKRKVSEKTKGVAEVPETPGSDTLFNQLHKKGREHVDVGGGTAWLWANKRAHKEPVDYLFIDEAGQLALANALAVSGGARNVVMLGDPQQLEQPQRGAHPDGADVSALEHMLGESATIKDDAGIFLEETWRLHPDIQRFTSPAFYEGRLKARQGLDKQAISAGPLKKTGLYQLVVTHSGNRNESIEEAETVANLVAQLLVPGATWTDRDGVVAALTLGDILIVAPYNAQVGRLRERLPPDARIGTVDKFQGQEAPIVIISMASSTAADAPKGIEFLLSANRLNVATSRAKCACVMVMSDGLEDIECRTPRQMKLANGLALYELEARAISLPREALR